MKKKEIVIKLYEEEYEEIVNDEACGLHTLTRAVANGKVLPEGHGDLVDRKELKKEVHTTTEWNGDVHRIIYEASVDDAPPIIEADNEEPGQ